MLGSHNIYIIYKLLLYINLSILYEILVMYETKQFEDQNPFDLNLDHQSTAFDMIAVLGM